MSYPDSMTLGEARAALREQVDKGARCPCCTQFSKVYRRKINSGMARALILLKRAGADQHPVHGPSVVGSHETAQLQWWGLIIPVGDNPQAEGAKTSGYWSMTELGVHFVNAQASVQKYAHIYDGRCLKLSGDQVTILHCLGDKFDYRELMAA